MRTGRRTIEPQQRVELDGRRRLLELYRKNLDLRADPAPVIERTDGVTASFLKELRRRAALLSAEEAAERHAAPIVENRHLRAALDELLDDRNQLTRRIAGGGPTRGGHTVPPQLEETPPRQGKPPRRDWRLTIPLPVVPPRWSSFA